MVEGLEKSIWGCFFIHNSIFTCNVRHLLYKIDDKKQNYL